MASGVRRRGDPNFFSYERSGLIAFPPFCPLRTRFREAVRGYARHLSGPSRREAGSGGGPCAGLLGGPGALRLARLCRVAAVAAAGIARCEFQSAILNARSELQGDPS